MIIQRDTTYTSCTHLPQPEWRETQQFAVSRHDLCVYFKTNTITTLHSSFRRRKYKWIACPLVCWTILLWLVRHQSFTNTWPFCNSFHSEISTHHWKLCFYTRWEFGWKKTPCEVRMITECYDAELLGNNVAAVSKCHGLESTDDIRWNKFF